MSDRVGRVEFSAARPELGLGEFRVRSRAGVALKSESLTVELVLGRFRTLAFRWSQGARDLGLASFAARDIMGLCDDIEAELKGIPK